jgi:hypothetical protein
MKSIFYLSIQFIHQKFCLKLIQLYNCIISINVFYGFNSKNTYLTILNLKLRISSFLNNIVSILKIFYLKFRFKLQNLNTSLNIKLKIILGKKLYPMMLLLFFNFNSLFVKFIYMYLNTVSILFGIVLSISLYSLTNIITFVSILFCLLVFSSFIIFVREFNINFTTSFIQLIIERDYNKYLQKIILIKFLLFYIYITSDFSLCESTWSKFAHDVFIGVGNQIGVQPKTTVSTLETVGIIAILGTISVGSIHLYNWSTGNVKPSIDERLNAIEHQLNVNNQVLVRMSTSFNQNFNSIIDAQNKYAQINAHAISIIGESIVKVEQASVENLRILDTKLNSIETKTTNIENTLVQNREAMEQYISTNVQSKLNSLETTFRTFSNKSNLSESEREQLNDLELEIRGLSTTLNSIPQSNIEPSSTSLTVNNSYDLNIVQSQLRSSLDAASFTSLQNLMNKNVNKISERNRPHSSSDLRLLSESKSTSTEFTSFQSKQTITFLIEHNKIKNMVINDSLSTSPNFITSIGNKLFNHIPTEFILKTVSTAITSTLSGTMTMFALNSILANFGFDSGSNSRALPSTMSSSERAGHTVITSLKDFIRGLKNGF